MFKSEGNFNVVITRAILAEPKFCKDPGAFDVCIEVQDEHGNSDWWRGEWSGQYGKGNFANRQQWQLTLESLKKVGLPNDDLFSNLQSDADGVASIPCLIGVQTTATVKMSEKEGKIYYNVHYLGDGGSAPKGLNLNSLLAAYGMTAPAAPQPQPAAPQPAAPQPAAQPVQQPVQQSVQQPAAASGTIPAFPGSAPTAAPNGPFGNLKR